MSAQIKQILSCAMYANEFSDENWLAFLTGGILLLYECRDIVAGVIHRWLGLTSSREFIY